MPKKEASENANSNNGNNNGHSQNVSLSFDPVSIRADLESKMNTLETKFTNRFERIEGNISTINKSIDVLNEKYSNIESSVKEIRDYLYKLNLGKKPQNDANNNNKLNYLLFKSKINNYL